MLQASTAFVPSPYGLARNTRTRATCVRRARMCAEASSPSEASSVAGIPGSLSDACAQARASVHACFSSGRRRVFVQIDTSNGDETYTLLKNTLPVVRMVAPALLDADADAAEQRVRVLLPDSGAAALLRRDWADAPGSVQMAGLGEAEVRDDDAGVLIVAPRASEVDKLERAVVRAGDSPVIVLSPDLVDMGVTGMSLNARQLRERLIDTFENAYYLRTFAWGVLLRAYPGRWGVWVDAPGTSVGFRLVAELDERPSMSELDDVLERVEGAPKQGVLSGVVRAFSRFINVYSRG